MQNSDKLDFKDFFQIGGFIFLLILLLLNYSKFLPLPDWAFTLLAVVAVVGLFATRVVRPYVQKRKSDKKVKQILLFTSRIRNLTRQYRLLAETPEDLNRSVGEITWSLFKGQMDLSVQSKFIFYRNLLSDETFASQKINKDVLKETEEHFNSRLRIQQKLKPVVFTEQRYWFSASGDDKSRPRAQEEVVPFLPFGIDRTIASTNFGGNYCVVIPVSFHSHIEKEFEAESKEQFLGYVGFINDDYVTDQIADRFQQAVERFQELYEKIKGEKVSLRIDTFLNLSQAQRVESSTQKNIPSLFAEKLSNILKDEFYADGVEVWLKGMPPPHKGTILKIVDKISIGHEIESVQGFLKQPPDGFHYDRLIELDGCALGFIRILRDKYDFSAIERNLLLKIEEDIDNYVRDLWEEHVVRQIDHQVFNVAPPDIKDFARLLTKYITKEFDSQCGLFEVQNGIEIFHTQQDYDTSKCIGILKALRDELRNHPDPKLGSYQNSYYLFMPLSLHRKERLGAIYLVGIGVLTDVHLKALKRLETHLDNIVRLYLAFERRYSAASSLAH